MLWKCQILPLLIRVSVMKVLRYWVVLSIINTVILSVTFVGCVFLVLKNNICTFWRVGGFKHDIHFISSAMFLFLTIISSQLRRGDAGKRWELIRSSRIHVINTEQSRCFAFDSLHCFCLVMKMMTPQSHMATPWRSKERFKVPTWHHLEENKRQKWEKSVVPKVSRVKTEKKRRVNKN